MSTAISSLPAIPVEVHELAAKEGVSQYLVPVLEMTREVFATAPISVVYDIDPEIVDDVRICIEVDMRELSDVDEVVRLHNSWRDGLRRICPTTHAWVFRLGLCG